MLDPGVVMPGWTVVLPAAGGGKLPHPGGIVSQVGVLHPVAGFLLSHVVFQARKSSPAQHQHACHEAFS